jgi:hypothetical protein
MLIFATILCNASLYYDLHIVTLEELICEWVWLVLVLVQLEVGS